jgi:uncharacterized protein (TIGR03032 family)
VPEDRCHLNGLAMSDGEPAYVTAVSESDVADGWRDRRTGGGIVIDVRIDEIVARGLTMPHSPRLHDGKLYLLDSGTGRFGTIDPGSGSFRGDRVLPGLPARPCLPWQLRHRGLSQPRETKTFSGLPLDEALAQRNADPICALMVIDLKTGAAVHWLKMEGILHELYDVVALPGIRRPQAIGLKTDEIRRILTIED